MRWNTSGVMNLRHSEKLALYLILNGATMLVAQQPTPMTLQQAIATSLRSNPDGAVSKAALDEATAQQRTARSALLPTLQFHESITRGNDPVYVFGTKLKQESFSQNDFSLNSLNRPQPLNNFMTQFSGTWIAFDSWHTEF